MKKFLNKSYLTVIIAAVTLVIGGLSGFIIGQNMSFSKSMSNQQNSFMNRGSSIGGFGDRDGGSGFSGYGRSGNSDNSNSNSNSNSNNSSSDNSNSNSASGSTGA